MRGVLVGLLVAVVLLVVADRVTVRLAERAVAARAQAVGGLSHRPDVQVRGVPFLSQALSGRYDDVRVAVRGQVGPAAVERLDVRLRGVQVPLPDLLRGRVSRVPVDALTGALVLSYAELSRQAPRGLTVAPEGDRLRLSGTARVLGQQVSAAAISTVRLDGDRILVRAQEFRTGSALADSVVGRALGDRFDFSVPVQPLPYGLALTAVRVRPDGLAVSADAGPTVLAP